MNNKNTAFAPTDRLKNMISNLSINELITMCNDIYDWNNTGSLDQKSFFYRFAKENVENTRELEECVLEETSKRLQKTCLILFKERPSDFLKTM